MYYILHALLRDISTGTTQSMASSDTLQNREPEKPLTETCVAAVGAPYDLSGWTGVRWDLGYVYNYNPSFTSFTYHDERRL